MTGSTSTNSTAAAHVSSVDRPTAADATAPPTRDDVFEVLSNRRRRYALHHLKQLDTDDPVDLTDVSTQVAAWELGIDADGLGYDDRKNVHTSLYQFHAPKMDELGLVNYDRRQGTVELTAYGEEVDVYLETVTREQIPWSVYFLLLSAGATGVVAGAWADLTPLLLVPDIGWAALVAVTFLVSSAVFVYHNHHSMRVGTDGPPPEVDD